MSASPPGQSAVVITCKCGRRLRLQGATPGRVGSCPECGARFQVGGAGRREAAPVSSTSEMGRALVENRSVSAPLTADEPGSLGYGVTPNATRPTSPVQAGAGGPLPLGPLDDREPRSIRGGANEPRSAIKPIGRGGILPLPKLAEKSCAGSLKYPLWDGTGAAALVLAPLPLAVVSLVVLAALPLVKLGGEMLLLGPILCGFIAVFALLIGYLGSVFSAFLVASTRGEVHHPRWPHFDLGAIATTLLHWVVAWAPGALIAGVPAYAMLRAWNAPGLFDRLVFWEMIALGGVYSVVALLAVVLHDDALAAAPHLVIPAMFRLGSRLVAPLVLLAAIVAVVVLAHASLVGLARFGVSALLGGAWLAWVIVVYLGLVLMRVLGRAYRKCQKRIGWFATKRIRRERPPEPAPTAYVPEL